MRRHRKTPQPVQNNFRRRHRCAISLHPHPALRPRLVVQANQVAQQAACHARRYLVRSRDLRAPRIALHRCDN